MRVIAGKYGGRKLISFDEKHIRPTTDRVKESLFNILGGTLDGLRVLDLFSGTGNLGIEALSRGAKYVCFVEQHPRSLKLIGENLKLIKATEGFDVNRSDAVRFVTKYAGEPFDVVLIDPPFPARICSTIMVSVSSNPEIIHDDSIVVIEHQSNEPLEKDIGSLSQIDTRSYGDKLLTFFKRVAKT